MFLKPFASKLIITFILTLLLISSSLLVITRRFQPKPRREDEDIHRIQNEYSLVTQGARWYSVLRNQIQGKEVIQIGLVNIDEAGFGENTEVITVRFDRVDRDRQWSDFFPQRIDEDEEKNDTELKEGSSAVPSSSCPELPMPVFDDYRGLDVIVAKVPCEKGAGREGIRDVFRLQLNLVVANLLVRSTGRKSTTHIDDDDDDQIDRTVYAVFIGTCGPMRELFRCEDLLMDGGDFFVYKPNLSKLKQKVHMPVGTCQLAPPPYPYEEPEPEPEPEPGGESLTTNRPLFINDHPREAYVTLLLNSDSFVCGAMTLAHSLIQTNTSKDLVLFVDDSLSRTSLKGLREAGWKIKRIKRIRSPSPKRKVFSEWNYSKLRVWQLTEYDKIIFIDSDLLVLENIDHLFAYPQLSAAGDVEDSVFNSGVMLVEPSKCTFDTLMDKMDKVTSYDDGDQGFLNEMFTWWHRWPSKINHLKVFEGEDDDDKRRHDILGRGTTPYAIHYVGVIKPWMCETEDYDCNWDVEGLRKFASDSAHRRWFQVYNAMAKRLQRYCEHTVQEDPTIAWMKTWRAGYKDIIGRNHLHHEKWKIIYKYCIIIIILSFIIFCLLILSRKKKLKSAVVDRVSSIVCPPSDTKSN